MARRWIADLGFAVVALVGWLLVLPFRLLPRRWRASTDRDWIALALYGALGLLVAVAIVGRALG